MALDRVNYRSIPVKPRDDWYVGMDVGQSVDPSALAAINHVVTTNENDWTCDDKNRIWKQKKIERFYVRHLERLPLQTAYPDQITHVLQLLMKPPLYEAKFGIDFTGCGRPVADSFYQAGLRPQNILITGGNEVTRNGGDTWHVPKAHLCAILESRLHSKELRIAPELPEAPVLKDELRDFNRKVSLTGHVTYNAKVGKHDDLIMSICIALFIATNRVWSDQVPLNF
jgi:hypothetical protein